MRYIQILYYLNNSVLLLRGVSASESVRMFSYLQPGVTLGHENLSNQKVFYVFTTDLKISLFLVAYISNIDGAAHGSHSA